MIRALDRGVGQVLDALQDNGLEENTLVIFTSDNGAAGYIGLPDECSLSRLEDDAFQGGLRVPYFIRWPGMIPEGTTVTQPVHHFDLFATAATAAGAALPADRKIDGIDLLPFVSGQVDSETAGVTHERLSGEAALPRPRLSMVGSSMSVARLVPSPASGYSTSGPIQPSGGWTLSEKHPKKVAELEAALEAHNAEQAASMWPSTASMGINIDKDLSIPMRRMTSMSTGQTEML